MERGVLRVPQRAELARLLQDPRVGDNRIRFRMPEIRADLQDQVGDVVEQALCRKDISSVHRQQVHQALEPARGEHVMFRAHPLRNDVAELRRDHDSATMVPISPTPLPTRVSTGFPKRLS